MGGAEGDDREDSHLGESGKAFQRRHAAPPTPNVSAVCRAQTAPKDSDRVLVLGVPAASWERQAHE